MFGLGPGGLLVTAVVASVYVLIPALAVAIGLRLAGYRRDRKPEDVLRSRFARGEISGAEFEARMTALRR